jgi:drug/metabolite transporter (DMT)-like permease
MNVASQINEKPTRAAYLLLFGLAAIWGSSFMLIRIGLTQFNPYELAGIRLVSAGLVMLPYSIKYLKTWTGPKWWAFAGVGLFNMGLPSLLFNTAQLHITSSLAGSLNALTPVAALVVGALFFKLRLTRVAVISIGIGLVGALLMIVGPALAAGSLGAMSKGWAWGTLCLVACVCYGFNVNIQKRFLQGLAPGEVAGGAMPFVLIPYGIFLSFSGVWQKLASGGVVAPTEMAMGMELPFGLSASMTAFLAVCFLGMVGTAWAIFLFAKLIGQTSVAFASTVTYLMPGGALIWSFILVEPITVWQLVGLAVVLGALALLGRK